MSWYIYPLFGIYLITCLVLIVVVLLQPGKGDAASALGGGIGSAAFGPRGAATTLAKVTMGAAATFMLLAFVFSIPGVLKSGSVAYEIADEKKEEKKAEEQQPPADTNAGSELKQQEAKQEAGQQQQQSGEQKETQKTEQTQQKADEAQQQKDLQKPETK
ncbi:MAG: preprotein translocase subunit SecG [Acidobacteriota bacterium]|nr:preprotein translocase subunit SecG [Blastocatellia bacterium]MDW8412406.1 preprotein translocase subunit SecG [Acidobacteriota bacterium]